MPLSLAVATSSTADGTTDKPTLSDSGSSQATPLLTCRYTEDPVSSAPLGTPSSLLGGPSSALVLSDSTDCAFEKASAGFSVNNHSYPIGDP